MRGYLSLDIMCSSKLTVFLEHKLFTSRNTQCPRTNNREYFRAEWRLLFIYLRVHVSNKIPPLMDYFCPCCQQGFICLSIITNVESKQLILQTTPLHCKVKRLSIDRIMRRRLVFVSHFSASCCLWADPVTILLCSWMAALFFHPFMVT